MARRIVSTNLWNGATLAGSSTLTSTACDISSSDALALYLTSITGTTPSVTFTYTMAPGTGDPAGQTFIAPQSPVTIGATKSAVDVMDFAPEATQWIKILAANQGTGAVVLSAYLVSQEADAS